LINGDFVPESKDGKKNIVNPLGGVKDLWTRWSQRKRVLMELLGSMERCHSTGYSNVLAAI